MGSLLDYCHHLLVHDGVSVIQEDRVRRHEAENKTVYGFGNKNVQNNYCYRLKNSF